MFFWLNGPGRVFRDPLPGSTNYLGAYDRTGNLLRGRSQQGNEGEDGEGEEGAEDQEKIDEEEADLTEEEREQRAEQREAEKAEQAERRSKGGLPKERQSDLRPYPLNRDFRSQPVLSEELREELYKQVVTRKLDLASVSAAFEVDMRRVAAVIRLKTIEKQWVQEGKKLAKPYNDAVLSMLPKTPYDPKKKPVAHESINDLPVHPSTRQQIFYPTSESRHFTRADAAKVFSPTLLPADERIPHPELIQLEKWSLQQVDSRERQKMMREKDEEARAVKKEKERRHAEWVLRTQKVVPGRRWDFKFQDVSVEAVGKDGRGRKGVGFRYGMAPEDRKRGQVKIPTSVE